MLTAKAARWREAEGAGKGGTERCASSASGSTRGSLRLAIS
eukprot:CAMPEP_0113593068 /NCGR_PEP_ID=MMETSP0015_2-20120614/38213_1 /TAXON_ID=2838 /ORGANISM="Odontella" /LENGTH=40 /DNA_ID=CAMNT_0000499707 /DNA_START=193 /DNA_END=315 /DNA_ORIENTATION=- /assembly_acc=CAM_ASM_000160